MTKLRVFGFENIKKWLSSEFFQNKILTLAEPKIFNDFSNSSIPRHTNFCDARN